MGEVRALVMQNLGDGVSVCLERECHSGMDEDDDSVNITISEGHHDILLRFDTDQLSAFVQAIRDFVEYDHS